MIFPKTCQIAETIRDLFFQLYIVSVYIQIFAIKVDKNLTDVAILTFVYIPISNPLWLEQTLRIGGFRQSMPSLHPPI